MPRRNACTPSGTARTMPSGAWFLPESMYSTRLVIFQYGMAWAQGRNQKKYTRGANCMLTMLEGAI